MLRWLSSMVIILRERGYQVREPARSRQGELGKGTQSFQASCRETRAEGERDVCVIDNSASFC